MIGLTAGALCQITRDLARTDRGHQYNLFVKGEVVVYVGTTSSGVAWVKSLNAERGKLIYRIEHEWLRPLSPLEALAVQADD